ncbi:capsule biosynthesis protein [uncultured Roseobacter sp.]|uniref:capsule biosynthesis protein n=1 Tax=uncultured Roseobacter sp. TaxID=114847 RepID=UPI00260777CE|nr:capsule biosynthesis protein [uncultured Roseobacter sp.]
MTTKPTARKFRIKRTSPGLSADKANPAERPLAPQTGQETGKAAEPPRKAPKEGAAEKGNVAVELDAIRREGLTGRQLRMARRVAHKHELAPTSDFDAVRLLRNKGIDPFQRSNMLELVVPKTPTDDEIADPGKEGSDAAKKKGRVQLPQTMPVNRETLPSTELSPAEMRNRQISEIQRDISRRRRRKLGMLLARLSFFVLLPTLIAGWYFYAVATPMYSTKSEFLILQADNQGGGIGGLLSGTQFATSSDSIAVQAFLLSKPAMLRLDEEIGFKSHYAQPSIDPIQRLPADASNEQAYKTYKKNVKVGYDPTEGLIRMEVIAADPNVSAEFSRALVSYAEQSVNGLSAEKRDDQMAEARAGFEVAEKERRAAQEALVNLQLQGATLDPEAVIAGLRAQINQVELQLLEKELQLAALLDNARPNQSRVDGARGDVRRLNEQLTELNARMTDASQGENSLAQLSVRIQMAQADLATRDMLLQSALQQMEQTRMEANRQVRYLTISVKPVPSEEASYPRKFENTIVAFLIFSGIYLMISLTASILREQVTS